MAEHDYMAEYDCPAMPDKTLGRLFTRLTPFQKAKHPTKPRTWYHCQCVCGGYVFASQAQLHEGSKKSCGCLRADAAIRIGVINRQNSMGRHKIGDSFNNLTLKQFHGIGRYGPEYVWDCDCGNQKIAAYVHAKSGHVKSCGCLQSENAKLVLSQHVHGKITHPNLTHGASKGGKRDLTYMSWSCMKTRCLNPRSSKYPIYGGRGIQICDAWLNDYQAFLNDMGPRLSKDMTLDRIDVDGDYKPSNCRWATRSQQVLNRRPTKAGPRGIDGRFLKRMENHHG